MRTEIARRDYANARFSGLDQINAQNVNRLKLAWTFSARAISSSLR
jgi:glucose dehydrogenase